MAGFRVLARSNIPCAPIIAHARLDDGRGFVILQDLAGYTPADKLIEQGFPFEQILTATAELTAKLHAARLHHRDLYLCHFMLRDHAGSIDAKLIDMARVAEMNNPLTRQRWIIKDLAQFWYSTTQLQITDEQRNRWLSCYAAARGITTKNLRSAISRKVEAIGRHDAELNRKRPERNVSIPG
jgi:tRNA A-37 threonylcarbamoyl transferase component Bud32